jgi:phosphoribosylformylglycinamidine synthase
MRAAVILLPGINREGDAARALRQANGAAPRIVWHADKDLPPGTDLVVLPGGFSYGDYLRCGAIAARAPIMRAVRDHAARGGLVLGICNGFQILCEAGLLPGVLMRNAHRRFICKMQHLRVENAQTPFTRRYAPGQVVTFAIAHGEGNFVADGETIQAIEAEGRVAFRYCDAGGRVGESSNPNGSTNAIAGVFNERFNVLGLMPHPENLIDPLIGGVDGRALFEGLAAA